MCEIPTQLADLDARNMLPSVILPAGNDGVEVRGFTQRRVEDGGQPFDHGGHWWIDSSVFSFLEVPLSATFFGGEQGEPLNPLAVVRKRVAFACDDGVCFHFFRSSRLRDSRVRDRPTWCRRTSRRCRRPIPRLPGSAPPRGLGRCWVAVEDVLICVFRDCSCTCL